MKERRRYLRYPLDGRCTPVVPLNGPPANQGRRPMERLTMPINKKKAAYVAAAEACKWAMEKGLGACDGHLLDTNHDGEVSVCVLGAMALRRALASGAPEDISERAMWFAAICDDIRYGSMRTALGMGSMDIAVEVANLFDSFLNSDILPIEPGKAQVF